MINDDDLFTIAKSEDIPLNAVFFKDDPPNLIHAGGYIINLQDSALGLGGSHFCAMYVPPKIHQIAYMDSMGFPPSQSTINWVKTSQYKNYPICYNTKNIQNINSGGCGIYSLYFIQFCDKHRTNIPMDELIEKFGDMFSDDSKKNLEILKKLAPYYMNSKTI